LNNNPLIFTEKDPYDVSRNIEKIYVKISLLFDYKIPNIGITTSLNFSLRGELDYKTDFYPLNNDDNTWHNLSNIERAELNSDSRNTAGIFLSDTVIYKPDPVRFTRNSQVFFMEKPSADLDNIIAFLFNLSQNHIGLFNRLNNDFAKCVGTLNRVSTPAEKSERGFIKLRFFDKYETPYDSEDVSEGVLYFLALLCIIHQPNPPKLLLLEEPEKGIHPRRIREVMNFIFELARLRDIQIILTSHSPYVVDHFADIPECISVFDRKDGETVIHNAADIIAETNAKLEATGEEPIHYTDALGEYWVSGFLGGVPEILIGN